MPRHPLDGMTSKLAEYGIADPTHLTNERQFLVHKSLADVN
jgi:hypothetical protein